MELCLSKQPEEQGGWYCSKPRGHEESEREARRGHDPKGSVAARWEGEWQ